jgi:hypothetical protein
VIGPRPFTQTFAYFVRPDAGFNGSIELPGAPFIASLMLRRRRDRVADDESGG